MNPARIALLEKYVSEEPDNPFNGYALAMEYYEEQPAKALSLLSSHITRFPSYLPSYFKLAHLYWEDDAWSLAEKTFLEGMALAQSTKETKAFNELSAAYQNFLLERD